MMICTLLAAYETAIDKPGAAHFQVKSLQRSLVIWEYQCCIRDFALQRLQEVSSYCGRLAFYSQSVVQLPDVP